MKMEKFPYKIQADIYKLDSVGLSSDPEKNIVTIVNKHSTNKENYKYTEIELNPEIRKLHNFRVKLYINKKHSSIPDWREFLFSVITDSEKENEHILGLNRKLPSMILFFYNENNIYVVTKGAGRHVIDNYIDSEFGISVLERLIDTNESDIRSANERGVIGSILSSSNYYKPNNSFNSTKSFGKFYKGVETFISKDKLEESLGISTSKTSLIIGGKNNLQINNKVTITDLANRIEKVNSLISKNKTSNINNFRKLNNRDLKKLKESLEFELIKLHFKQFLNNEKPDLYHPNLDAFLNAEAVILKFEKEPFNFDLDQQLNLIDIFDLLKISFSNLDEFSQALKDVSSSLILESEGNQLYRTQLVNWLDGEVKVEDIKYFKFDGGWYKYENEFLIEIKFQISYLLSKLGKQINLPNWKKSETEYQYNLSFKSSDFIICDKALYSKIEICDFFKYDDTDKSLKLYHVKNNWGQSIRVVYNQIINGAKFLSELRANNDNQELRKYFEAVSKQNYKDDSLSWLQFKKLFKKTKSITFVMAYATESTKDRDSQILSSTSNIGKLSVLQCEHELRTKFEYNFDLVQIKRI